MGLASIGLHTETIGCQLRLTFTFTLTLTLTHTSFLSRDLHNILYHNQRMSHAHAHAHAHLTVIRKSHYRFAPLPTTIPHLSAHHHSLPSATPYIILPPPTAINTHPSPSYHPILPIPIHSLISNMALSRNDIVDQRPPCQHNRKGKGGGKPINQSREVTVSKALSFVLRHGAAAEGIQLYDGGWAIVSDLVSLIFDS